MHLSELLDDLHANGAPSAAWLARHRGAADPLHSAWARETSRLAFARILALAGRSAEYERLEQPHRLEADQLRSMLGPPPSLRSVVEVAEAVHRLVDVRPEPLADFVSAGAWLSSWCRSPGDPVVRAWTCTESPNELQLLLQLVGDEASLDRAMPYTLYPVGVERPVALERACRAIRALRAAPTLAELSAAVAADPEPLFIARFILRSAP